MSAAREYIALWLATLLLLAGLALLLSLNSHLKP